MDADFIQFAQHVSFDGECWLWTGPHSHYGRFRLDSGVHVQAHRLAFLFFRGRLRCGYHIHHLCERPLCVYPYHLEQLSPRAHARRHANIPEHGKLVPITFEVKGKLLRQIKGEVRRTGRTQSDLIRTILQAHIETGRSIRVIGNVYI